MFSVVETIGEGRVKFHITPYRMRFMGVGILEEQGKKSMVKLIVRGGGHTFLDWIRFNEEKSAQRED